MLQQDVPDDYVVSTGESHSVKEFLQKVFSYLDLDWQEYVETDPYYFRPTEVDFLLGDSSKARNKLNWKPKIGFQELIRIMTEHDLELAEREVHAHKFSKR
jgi:GDPmannose 4,6-dehydratase